MIDPNEPLELLPFGRTREDEAKLQAKKKAGRTGFKLFLWQGIILAMFLVYIAGWMNGRHP